MSHLYLFSRSDDPGLLKIGRSDNPHTRALALQKHHAFHILIFQVFPNIGKNEANTHSLLFDCRVTGVPGCEWFRCPVEQAIRAIERSQPITKSKDKPYLKAKRRLEKGIGKYSRRYPELTASYACAAISASKDPQRNRPVQCQPLSPCQCSNSLSQSSIS